MTQSKKGFASMDPAKHREIARRGGIAAQATGRTHRYTPEEAREAGRKGGATVSTDRAHMAAIGRMGGQVVARDRAHMSEIGRKGGAPKKGAYVGGKLIHVLEGK